MDVFSDSQTTYVPVDKQASACPAGTAEGDPSCKVSSYTVTEPITRTTSAPWYGAEPITYAQFRVMTDPHYDEKLTELEDLSHKCERSNIPRYVGISMMVAGLVAGSIVARDDVTTGSYYAYAGLLGGGATYGLGYFALGGSDCKRARALSSELDMTTAMTLKSVDGPEYAAAMKTLAQRFNAAHSSSASASAGASAGDNRSMRMRH
jgi:hypothetical protein